jgi:hypothetical protein
VISKCPRSRVFGNFAVNSGPGFEPHVPKSSPGAPPTKLTSPDLIHVHCTATEEPRDPRVVPCTIENVPEPATMTIKCGMIPSEDEVLRMAAESPFLNPSQSRSEKKTA